MIRKYLAGVILAFAGALIAVQSVNAQLSVSPAQMQMFNNLSDSDKARIMQQLGVGGSGSSAPAVQTIPDVAGPTDFSLFPQDSDVIDPFEELRIKGDDTIVITTRFGIDVDPAVVDVFMADPNRARFVGTFLRRLDKRGNLDLPGIASIPLGGLSAEEVAIRLSSEPMLQSLDPLIPLLEIEVTILPLTPSGRAGLKPFGYELFGAMDNVVPFDRDGMFSATAESMPVPRDYVLGPGDTLNVQLYGTENYSMPLRVNRDGTINLPKTGPKTVAGLTFGEVKEDIENRIDEQLIGTEAAVTMGTLRSIQVFVVGDVKRPGAYSISSLARITNALAYAGGITEIGSMRRIELRRDGQRVARLDLYDLLLRGDSSNDAQLRANDVILVPPAMIQVGIDGEVRRPAIYELKSKLTAGTLIDLAGGLTPSAAATSIQLERVDQRGSRSIETVDVLASAGKNMPLQAGDFVTVVPVVEELQDAVFLGGHTTRPGGYEWEPGMRLLDLIAAENYLLPKADLGYVLIRREQGEDRQITVLSADLARARLDPQSTANVVLQSRDHVTIFQLGIARSAMIASLLDELQAQATRDRPFQMVKVGGQVRAPGEYPLEQGMRVSDLIRAGGGLTAGAYSTLAELTNYVIDTGGEREIRLVDVNLAAVMSGDVSADPLLGPYDYLNVKEIPEWHAQDEVTIMGEIRFPGAYPMRRGETLKSVLKRAGGLTDLAFPSGSVFTRVALRNRESEQIDTLVARLESDLAGLGLRTAADPSSNSDQAMSAGQNLLVQLKQSRPTGRLVIDLNRVLAAEDGSMDDIVMRAGDVLMVPVRSQEVTVIGEVQYATSHFFDQNLARDEYINLSGGTTANADNKRIYVVRANGAVVAGKSSRWFKGKSVKIYPGDTVVVPMDTDRTPKLAQWTGITQVIYQMAIAVAAVNSF